MFYFYCLITIACAMKWLFCVLLPALLGACLPGASAVPPAKNHRWDFVMEQQPGDTLYFDGRGYLVAHPWLAHEYMTTRSLGGNRYVQFTYSYENVLLEILHFKRRSSIWVQADGLHRKWNRQGELIMEAFYKEDVLHGTLLTFWADYRLKRDEQYVDGVLVKGRCYDEQGREVPHYPYFVAPAFPGGAHAFFASHIGYPPRALWFKTQGYVLVRFMVDQHGQVQQVEVLRGKHQDLNREVLRVLQQMPPWMPGRRDGQACDMRVEMPFVFKL